MTAHNRRDKTLSCIDRVLGQRLPEHRRVQVLLVDDGSTDGTKAAVTSAHPSTIVIDGDGSLYWGGGMRLGIAEAISRGAEWLWLVNDDVVFYDDALNAMLLSLDTPAVTSTEESPWVVGATIDPATGLTSYSGWRRYGRLRPRAEMLDPVGHPVRCDSANFNSILLRADQYLALGGLDPLFIHNAGDNDLTYRATNSGIPLLLAGEYVGVCGVNPPPVWRDGKAPLLARLRDLHSVKHFPPRQSLTFNLRHAGLAGVALFLHPYLTITKSALTTRRRKPSTT